MITADNRLIVHQQQCMREKVNYFHYESGIIIFQIKKKVTSNFMQNGISIMTAYVLSLVYSVLAIPKGVLVLVGDIGDILKQIIQ